MSHVAPDLKKRVEMLNREALELSSACHQAHERCIAALTAIEHGTPSGHVPASFCESEIGERAARFQRRVGAVMHEIERLFAAEEPNA